MFQKSYFILFFLLITGQAFSQSDHVSGPIIRMTMQSAWADLNPVGEDANYVYYIHFPYSAVMSGPAAGNSDYYVGKVNKKTMELEETRSMELQFEGNELNYEFAYSMGDKIYVFSSFQNTDQEKTYLFTQTLDKASLKLNPDFKKIGEVDFSGESKYKSASFDYEFSPDSSKILMTYSLLDKEGSMLRFGYEVFDREYRRIDEWTGDMGMNDGIYQFDQFRISNLGYVYLLTRYFPDKKAYRKSTDLKKDGFLSNSRSVEYNDNYEIRVVVFNKNEQQTKAIPVEVPDKFFTTADIGIKGDNVILIGFYSPVGSTLPEGATFVELNQSGKVLKVSKKEFGDLFREPSDISNKSNGLLGSADYDQYRFVLKDIHYKSDGGFVLVGERTVTQTKTQSSAGSVTVTTVYHTDDLAVVDVSPAGDIRQVYKIEKNQETTGLGYFYSSYCFVEVGGTMYVVLTNIGKRNFNLLGKLKNTQAELVSIDPSGKMNRRIIFNSDEDRITLRARDSFLSSGNLVLYGHENNRYARFIKVPLN